MWRTWSLATALLALSLPSHAQPASGAATPSPTPAAKWAQPPSAAAVDIAYPERAANFGVSGQATVNCLALAGGKLTDCRIVSETPSGADFGRAAVTLAPHGTIVTDYNGVSLVGKRIETTIGFIARRRGD
jgi:protein TonB